MEKRILITGAAGNIGRKLVRKIKEAGHYCFATDIGKFQEELEGIEYGKMDITNLEDLKQIKEKEITHIIHLATILPRNGIPRSVEYKVDVGGTKNILEACVEYGVEKLILTTSGASYGYHSDGKFPLKEDDPIRGNHVFGYSYHKRLIENYVEYYRNEKGLKILLFRPCTVLGEGMASPIADLLKKKIMFDIQGSLFPFSFVWDEDVVGFMFEGVESDITGNYNLAGDGFLTAKEVAKKFNKVYLALPAPIVQTGLAVLKKFNLSQYGPEQIDFLRYRPALDNEKSKRDFTYQYRRTSEEAIDNFL
jgi:UDP-glucose 4-epimerase